MNTGHPISTAYLGLGALLAFAVVIALALLLTLVFRGPVPLPLDPALPFPAVRS